MNNFFCEFLEKLVNIFVAIVIGLVLGGLILGVVALFEWNLPCYLWCSRGTCLDYL